MSVVSTESQISSLQSTYWFLLKQQKKIVDEDKQKFAGITKDFFGMNYKIIV